MEITKENIHQYVQNIFELDKTIKCETEISVYSSVSLEMLQEDHYKDLLFHQLLKELNS
jgi:hypothetical protein